MTHPTDPLTPATPTPLADVLQDALQRLVQDGRDRLLRVAEDGRDRIRLRQRQRDRDALLVRLGRTSWRLVQEREIDHPSLRKAVDHLEEIEAEIRHLQEAVDRADQAAAQDDAGAP